MELNPDIKDTGFDYYFENFEFGFNYFGNDIKKKNFFKLLENKDVISKILLNSTKLGNEGFKVCFRNYEQKSTIFNIPLVKLFFYCCEKVSSNPYSSSSELNSIKCDTHDVDVIAIIASHLLHYTSILVIFIVVFWVSKKILNTHITLDESRIGLIFLLIFLF
jgi:hypothetical protein